jgi:hypothetical protein
MSNESNHLKQLLRLLGGLDTEGKDYQLHKEIIRLGQTIEHDIEAGK